MSTAGLGVATPDISRVGWIPAIGRIVTTDRLVWIALALIWILGHSFVGIQHDGRIYMGRALADLDPAGVGRDMMFELDGQSGFTLFRFLARTLVAALGLGPTVGLLAILNLAAWFAAIVCLARVLVPGRAALLVLLVALVLPRAYGPLHVFAAGESLPIPRPLAEAGVLLALAAFLADRMRLGLACLVCAALFHPIMAAPGFAVLFVLRARRDRRWLVAAALGLVLVCVGAAIGAPLVSRLLVVVDPAWRAVLVERNPYLWLKLWPAEAYGALAVQCVTIVIAAALLEARARLLLLSVLATGVLGVLVSLAFGDGLGSLLVIQAQLWRAVWLPAALAPLAAGICAWRLTTHGEAGWIAAALLALAWITMEWMPLGPLAGLAAAAVLWLDHRSLVDFRRGTPIAVAIICALLILVALAVPLSALFEVWNTRPAGTSLPWSLAWGSGVMIVPVVGAALAWWLCRPTAAARVCVGLAVAMLAVLATLGWDSRAPYQASVDSGYRRPDLEAMLAARPGEVLWLYGDAVWSWLGRPNWTGGPQGAAVVFSRTLALKWHERSAAAIAHGLAKRSLLTPWARDLPKDPVDITRADVKGFCRRADAPAWIVAPLEVGRPAPALSGLAIWTPGGVDRSFATGKDGFRWISTDRFAVIACRNVAEGG